MPIVDWKVIIANVIAAILALGFTSAAGGVFYLVWRLPTSQSQILDTLHDMQKDQVFVKSELRRLEVNDRVQDNRLTAIEAKTGHR